MEEIMDEIYQLETDDEYFQCCGEILLTLKGLIVFHCNLCELKYKGFQKYFEHLRRTHFLKLDECLEQNMKESTSNDLNKLKSCPTVFGTNENKHTEIIEIEHTYNIETKQAILSDDKATNIEVLEEDAYLIKQLLVGDKQKPIDNKDMRGRSKRNSSSKKHKLTRIECKAKEKAPIFAEFLDGAKIFGESQNVATTNLDNTLKDGIKSIIDSDLDPQSNLNELPSCDRPTLKPSRKPASSLTDEQRKHKCPYCLYSSKDKTNLWSHIQRHSNNKPHQCSHCPKNFHTRVELTFHTRYHTGERPFLCSECGRSFVTKEHLKQHIKRHKNQRDYNCTDCNKGFFSCQELREHMTVHTKETPFKCELCDRVFTRKKSLNAHKKLHENKRSYRCKLCNVGFNQSAGLYLHMKTKHQVSKQKKS